MTQPTRRSAFTLVELMIVVAIIAIVAAIAIPGETGDRWLWIDGTGVIRYRFGSFAGPTADPLE